MFKVNIKDDEMLREARNYHTYMKGLDYYKKGRVVDLQLEEEDDEPIIFAEVIGSQRYLVSIDLHPDGTVSGYFCDCPAFAKYDGICKHVVAVLKAAQDTFGKPRAKSSTPKTPKDDTNQYFFNYFDSLNYNPTEKEVNLELTLGMEKGSHGFDFYIELRIGEEKLYVVKNIKEFVGDVKNHKTIEFGKNFTFKPYIHTFSPTDRAIIDLTMNHYDYEATAAALNPYTHASYISFKGKRLYISDTNLLKMLEILENRTFIFVTGSEKYEDMTIIKDRSLPVKFNLVNDKENLVLKMDVAKDIFPLTYNGRYFFSDNLIYKLTDVQLQPFVPFYNHLRAGKNEQLVFEPHQSERFISEILPQLSPAGEVTIDPNLEKRFYHEELTPKIYFDRMETGIYAGLEFCYGDEVFNPFSPKRNANNGRLLIRDAKKEQNIMGLLGKADFKVAKEKIYLQDEIRIFDFLSETLPELHKLAEIYYSEAFKRMSIRDPRSFTGRIRLNEGSDLLQFSFEFEGVDKSELQSLFLSLKEKKKYYRLKDGSFMPLESPELIEVSELLEHLHISDKDLKNNVIELPKYKALYMDKKLRDSKLDNVEKNTAFKQMVQNITEPKDMDFQIPHSLKNVLRDYQKTGYKWLKTLTAYGMGGILADDMGLGKTLEALTFILSEKEKDGRPVLVISPTSLIYNWQAEVNKFVPGLKSVVIAGTPHERWELLKVLKGVDIVITSYPLIRRDIGLYKNIEFSCCILDEAQHIKNPDSINAKTAKSINAKVRFALTGTPIENSLTELWSIFDFILPGYLMSHNKFVKNYEKPIVREKDSGTLKELGKLISPFVLRRMKKDVLKELPDKIENKIVSELTEEQKKVYMAYLQQTKKEIYQEIEDAGFEKSRIKVLAALTRLRQICCHPGLFIENYMGGSGKLQQLEELMTDALESGHRILLFSQFTSMLSIIKVRLDKEGIEYFYLDGSTKSKLRGQMVQSFNSGERKVFLISLKAGGTGLNLTGADMVIHFDPWWNPAVEDQASDRAHRIGQKNVVHVVKLISRGTIEEKVYELQQRKKELISAVIKPGETMLAKMSREEILDLFA